MSLVYVCMQCDHFGDACTNALFLNQSFIHPSTHRHTLSHMHICVRTHTHTHTLSHIHTHSLFSLYSPDMFQDGGKRSDTNPSTDQHCDIILHKILHTERNVRSTEQYKKA